MKNLSITESFEILLPAASSDSVVESLRSLAFGLGAFLVLILTGFWPLFWVLFCTLGMLGLGIGKGKRPRKALTAATAAAGCSPKRPGCLLLLFKAKGWFGEA